MFLQISNHDNQNLTKNWSAEAKHLSKKHNIYYVENNALLSVSILVVFSCATLEPLRP